MYTPVTKQAIMIHLSDCNKQVAHLKNALSTSLPEIYEIDFFCICLQVVEKKEREKVCVHMCMLNYLF